MVLALVRDSVILGVVMANRGGIRVLVVDDQADMVVLLSLGLAKLGYEVDVALDGLTALEKAVAFRPHIVVVDLVLPIIDGWELAERLRSNAVFRRPRLVALSGLGDARHRARS